MEVDDPLEQVVAISRKWKPVLTEGMPRVFTGGWSGYCGYDTVRYVYAGEPIQYPLPRFSGAERILYLFCKLWT